MMDKVQREITRLNNLDLNMGNSRLNVKEQIQKNKDLLKALSEVDKHV